MKEYCEKIEENTNQFSALYLKRGYLSPETKINKLLLRWGFFLGGENNPSPRHGGVVLK